MESMHVACTGQAQCAIMVVNSDPLQVVPAYPFHRGVELGLEPDSGLASWWNYVLAGE